MGWGCGGCLGGLPACCTPGIWGCLVALGCAVVAPGAAERWCRAMSWGAPVPCHGVPRGRAVPCRAMGYPNSALWGAPVLCHGEPPCRAAPRRAVPWGAPVRLGCRCRSGAGAGARRIPPPRGRCAPERGLGRRQLLRTARGGRGTAAAGSGERGAGTGAGPGECGRGGGRRSRGRGAPPHDTRAGSRGSGMSGGEGGDGAAGTPLRHPRAGWSARFSPRLVGGPQGGPLLQLAVPHARATSGAGGG